MSSDLRRLTCIVLNSAEHYGRARSKHWRATVAGAAAGPAILLTGQTQTSLAIYIYLRSVVLLVRCVLVRALLPARLLRSHRHHPAY